MMDTSVESFHGFCRKIYNSSTCPVCDYIKNPHLIQNSVCMTCGGNGTIYCIICGFVGCSDWDKNHASEHFIATQHHYQIILSNFSVWDCKIRKCVHLLNAKERIKDNVQTHGEANAIHNCSCVVCQHKRKPKLLQQSTCMECRVGEVWNLWICLFCSHIGCCRYNNKHALEHCTKTQHPYAMQMGSFAIWNYKENKCLHRELDDTVTCNSNTNKINNQPIIEDLAKHLDRLEGQWQEFSKLTETNQKIITIEEGLLSLTDEKKILENKIYENEIKLNELLAQVAKISENLCPANNAIEEIQTEDSVILRNIKPDPDLVITPTNSFSTIHCPQKATISFDETKLLFILILGLLVYYFLRLCFQRMFTELF